MKRGIKTTMMQSPSRHLERVLNSLRSLPLWFQAEQEWCGPGFYAGFLGSCGASWCLLLHWDSGHIRARAHTRTFVLTWSWSPATSSSLISTNLYFHHFAPITPVTHSKPRWNYITTPNSCVLTNCPRLLEVFGVRRIIRQNKWSSPPPQTWRGSARPAP